MHVVMLVGTKVDVGCPPQSYSSTLLFKASRTESESQCFTETDWSTNPMDFPVRVFHSWRVLMLSSHAYVAA